MLSHIYFWLFFFFFLLKHVNPPNVPLERIFSHAEKSRNQFWKDTEVRSWKSLNCLNFKRTEMVERQAHPPPLPHHLLISYHQLLNGELTDLLLHCLVLTLQRKEEEPAGRCWEQGGVLSDPHGRHSQTLMQLLSFALWEEIEDKHPKQTCWKTSFCLTTTKRTALDIVAEFFALCRFWTVYCLCYFYPVVLLICIYFVLHCAHRHSDCCVITRWNTRLIQLAWELFATYKRCKM